MLALLLFEIKWPPRWTDLSLSPFLHDYFMRDRGSGWNTAELLKRDCKNSTCRLCLGYAIFACRGHQRRIEVLAEACLF